MVFRRYSLFEMRSSDSGTELASFECKPYGVGGEARADLRDGFSFASLEAGALEHDGFVLFDAAGACGFLAFAQPVAGAFLRTVSPGISFVWRE
jgi:hypothetical protein